MEETATTGNAALEIIEEKIINQLLSSEIELQLNLEIKIVNYYCDALNSFLISDSDQTQSKMN